MNFLHAHVSRVCNNMRNGVIYTLRTETLRERTTEFRCVFVISEWAVNEAEKENNNVLV